MCAVTLVLSGAGDARANDPADRAPPADPADAEAFRSRSQSVGIADRGGLRNGVRLGTTGHVDARRGTYGTQELVDVIARAAARVADAFANTSRLTVGDLSRARGGRMRPHRSHQSGRDADIGFYLLDAQGLPASPGHFVHLDATLTGEHREVSYRFDVARNWALLVALLEDPVARVQFIFVAQPLRDALLAHAASIGEPAELIERVTIALHRDRGNAHRSHFHVRIYCPVDDRATCMDEPPYHAWYVGDPPSADVQRQLAQRRRAIQQRSARQRAMQQRAAQRRAAQRRAAQRRAAQRAARAGGST